MSTIEYCPNDFLGNKIFTAVLDFIQDPVIYEPFFDHFDKLHKVKIRPEELKSYKSDQLAAPFGIPHEPGFIPLSSQEIFRCFWNENSRIAFEDCLLGFEYLAVVFQNTFSKTELNNDTLEQQLFFPDSLSKKIRIELRSHTENCPDCGETYLRYLHDAVRSQVSPTYVPAAVFGILPRPIMYLLDRAALNRELLNIPLSNLEKKIFL